MSRSARQQHQQPQQQQSIVKAKAPSTAGSADVVPTSSSSRSFPNLKVNAGGRLLEVSREASLSVILLRRELVAQLNVASASSVQVADLAGKPISSDEDLRAALQDGKHPLQAKLTVSALHEIEQKKREAEGKKEELLNYQWQVLCEQIHNISSEVGLLASQLSGVKEDCNRAVRQFQETEELRRVELYGQIGRETANREDLEKALMTKMDILSQHIVDERLARDVAVKQAALRIEQVDSAFNADRSNRARDQEAMERQYSALRHDFEMDAQKRADDWSQNLEMLKRTEAQLSEQHLAELEHSKRLSSIEAEVEKLRSSIAVLETSVALNHRVANDGLQRSGEELKRAVKTGNLSADSKTHHLLKTFEINQHSLEVRVQSLREEVVEDRASLENRAQATETRCLTVEKELADYQNAQALREQLVLDRLNGAMNVMESLEMAQKANDVVISTTSTQVTDVMDQLHSMQGTVHERVRSDHAKNQFETLHTMLSNHQQKTAQLEQEINARLAQEAAHRDALRLQVHDSMQKAFDKITLKLPEASINSGSLPLRRSQSVATVRFNTNDSLAAEEGSITHRGILKERQDSSMDLSAESEEIGGVHIATTSAASGSSDGVIRCATVPPGPCIVRTPHLGVTASYEGPSPREPFYSSGLDQGQPLRSRSSVGASASGGTRVISLRPASASVRRGPKAEQPPVSINGAALSRRVH